MCRCAGGVLLHVAGAVAEDLLHHAAVADLLSHSHRGALADLLTFIMKLLMSLVIFIVVRLQIFHHGALVTDYQHGGSVTAVPCVHLTIILST